MRAYNFLFKGFLVSLIVIILCGIDSYAVDGESVTLNQVYEELPIHNYLKSPQLGNYPSLKPKGAFQNNLYLGAATYSYPIGVPPGTNSLQPMISIVYKSHLYKHFPSLMESGWTLVQDFIQRDVNYSFDDSSDDKFVLFLDGKSYDLKYVEMKADFTPKSIISCLLRTYLVAIMIKINIG